VCVGGGGGAEDYDVEMNIFPHIPMLYKNLWFFEHLYNGGDM